MKKPKDPELTPEEIGALRKFAAKEGRYWKNELMTLWSNGRDATRENGSLLRSVRNKIGPSGLQKFRFPEPSLPKSPPHDDCDCMSCRPWTT